VKLVAATLYALRIPFVESVRHAAFERRWSDSVVVRVRDERGTEGFGEGTPRAYVTGERVDTMLDHLAGALWPAVARCDLPEPAAPSDLAAFDAALPDASPDAGVTHHASRAALELAMLDCALRRHARSLAALLPPRRPGVTYSGVVPAGPLDRVAQHGRALRTLGFRHVKLKVGFDDDVARVRAAREALGPEVSLRLDANGAWDVARATEVLTAVAPLAIAAVEQPLPRGPAADLRRLREATGVPIIADESAVTWAEAEALVAANAIDGVNVRVSKCGGLARSFALAGRVAAAGRLVQVGSQVGETSILAAAGRHLAAALAEVAVVEGSFGTLLLAEDVTADSVRFGHGGRAPLLSGPGLGVRVLEPRLRAHAAQVRELA
jgi:L-alanine-DL-glutamate epimerase-like enolase superfamily enzyme